MSETKYSRMTTGAIGAEVARLRGEISRSMSRGDAAAIVLAHELQDARKELLARGEEA